MGIPPFLMIFFGLAFGPIGGVPVGIVNHDSQGLGKAYLSSISKDFILPVSIKLFWQII